MFKPDLFSKYSKVQAKNNFALLKKYENIAYWTGSRCESVIDLGSGDGSFTSSKLIKFLPENCEIIGVDKFNDMVQYANNNYKTDQINFKMLDATDILPVEYSGNFNHVFSFFTLHLVRDQIKAFSNVYRLLSPGGSCFITMVGKAKVHDSYISLQNMPKWNSWLSNVDAFISNYADCLDPVNTVSNIITEVGFSNTRVGIEEIVHDFVDINEFKDFISSINVSTVPDHLYDNFLNDFVDVSLANGLIDNNLRMKLEVIVAFAMKIGTDSEDLNK